MSNKQPIRQYRIITKTPGTPEVMLEVGANAVLYNIPEIRAAVDFIKANPNTEMVGIRIDTRFYGIVVTYNDTILENHFEL
jgi:hypothetical protein